MPPAYAEARAAMERGDLDGAAKAFEQELAANPGDPVAKTGLAQVNLIRRVSSYDQAKARRDAAEHPGDVAAQTRVADIDLASGRIEEAFDRLLGVVRRTSGEEREQAREHLVGLFEVLPPRDPQRNQGPFGPVRPAVLTVLQPHLTRASGNIQLKLQVTCQWRVETGYPAESSRKPFFWR